MKKAISMLLAFAICVMVAGCSKNTGSEAPASDTGNSAGNAIRSDDVNPPQEIPLIEGAAASRDDLTFPIGEPVPFPEYFTGNAYLAMMIPNDDVFNLPIMSNVTFEPGVRNNWHSHEGGQVLLVTGGVGYYQQEGQTAQLIREGDVVLIQPDVKHWHGAAPDSWFSHIAISTNPDDPGTEWMEEVSNEEYGNLVAEEFTGRDNTDDDFMFAKGNELNMDTFNGTNYVAMILLNDDIFNMPGIMNVIFEPGVINNWHIHEGGQVMIATDGIGFHQIEGEAVQVLYPGDVAMCPPGEKHWHGAGPDGWFAHLAIGTNPEMTGLDWLEPVSEEEYSTAVEAVSERSTDIEMAQASTAAEGTVGTQALSTAATLTMNDMVIPITLNDTLAAQDLISRLPFTVTASRSSVDYCGIVSDPLDYAEEELRSGWENGDIAFLPNGNWFAILFDGANDAAPGFATMGRVDAQYLSAIEELGNTVEVTVSLAE